MVMFAILESCGVVHAACAAMGFLIVSNLEQPRFALCGIVSPSGDDPAGESPNLASRGVPRHDPGSRFPELSGCGARWVPRQVIPAGANSGAGGFPPKQKTNGGRTMRNRAGENEFPISLRGAFVRDGHDQKSYDGLAAELQAALAREAACLQEKNELSRRQAMLAEEFEHRLVNGLQLIVSLLSLQSRTAPTPEAAHQLTIAARRVSAIGRVHHQLHLLDHQDRVEFKQYLQRLCEDLSGLLFREGSGYAIVVEGADAEIPTTLAIPLGFIVNELITNSAKYAEGHITVQIDALSQADRSLSVIDDGPGLPAGFEPSGSKGLGMKIVQSLVKQIGGELRILPGDNGRGTRVTVKF
jgi:two-component sensor histidine kinase